MLINWLQKLQWIAAFTVIVLVAPSYAESSLPPPLKPNEVISKTKDGCGFVLDNSSPMSSASDVIWGGACINGLAMGEGRVSEGEHRYTGYLPSNGWVWYGRQFGSIEYRRETGLAGFMYRWDGKYVQYNTLSISKPVWRAKFGDSYRDTESSRVNDGNSVVTATTFPCGAGSKIYPQECIGDAMAFSVYGVIVGDLQTKKGESYFCPNPRAPQGCETLWAQHAGPVIERIKVFVAENEPKAEARRREIASLIASWRPSSQTLMDQAANDAEKRASQLAALTKDLAEKDKRDREYRETSRQLKETEKKVAAQIAAAEKAQAERNAQDRREALGILLGTVGQYQQQKTGQRQAQYEEQPRIGTPAAGLSNQQIYACSEEIKRTQIESQRWGGDVNAVANRLGRFQKELFEGKCSGHPEAQAYIAGANKMMGYSANAGNGSSLPPLASSGGTGRSGSPDPSRSRKVHNPAADAKGCTELIQGRERGVLSSVGGNKTFVNNCPTTVEFFWCTDNECTRDRGNTWAIRAGGSWPVDGTNVRWGACRGRDSGGFDKGSQGQRYTCPNLIW